MLSQISDPECTFRPAITQSPSIVLRADGNLAASERLFRDAAEQARKLQEAQEMADREFTFSPSINRRLTTNLAATASAGVGDTGPRVSANEALYDKVGGAGERGAFWCHFSDR